MKSGLWYNERGEIMVDDSTPKYYYNDDARIVHVPVEILHDGVRVFKYGLGTEPDIAPGEALHADYFDVSKDARDEYKSREGDVLYPAIYAYDVDLGNQDTVPLAVSDSRSKRETGPVKDLALEYAKETGAPVVLYEGPVEPHEKNFGFLDYVEEAGDYEYIHRGWGSENLHFYMGGAIVASPSLLAKTHEIRLNPYQGSRTDPTRFKMHMTHAPDYELYHGTPIERKFKSIASHPLATHSVTGCRGVFLTENENVAALYTQPWHEAKSTYEFEGNYDSENPAPGSILTVKVDWGEYEQIPHITYTGSMGRATFDDVTDDACALALDAGYPAFYIEFSGAYDLEPELVVLDTGEVDIQIISQARWAEGDDWFDTLVDEGPDDDYLSSLEWNKRYYEENVESLRKKLSDWEMEQQALRNRLMEEHSAGNVQRSRDDTTERTVEPVGHQPVLQEGNGIVPARNSRRRGQGSMGMGNVNVEFRNIR